jgi:hypothetical protein
MLAGVCLAQGKERARDAVTRAHARRGVMRASEEGQQARRITWRKNSPQESRRQAVMWGA